MKTFLTVYDYGQGAVWLRIDAGQVPGSGRIRWSSHNVGELGDEFLRERVGEYRRTVGCITRAIDRRLK